VSKPIRFGRGELWSAERRLLIDGQSAALGARAFDLLLVLIERRDRVVPKSELLDLVWPGLVVEENNLQVQISALRKVLGPRAISTIPGRGYRFTLDLDALSTEQPDLSAFAPHARPQETARGNLPVDLPPLIGRDDAVRELLNCVETHRLVTITGAGGMGKTTLALAVARQLQRKFKDGAWLVELASVSDPALVAQTVAQTLRIAVNESGAALERLIDVLATQQLLLVLDNSEHVAEATGRLALALTTRVPGLRALVTSQKLLNVPGEAVLKLGPLATPTETQREQIEHFGAVRLFVERAQTLQPDFAITSSNAEAVAEICRRLDGMPLAIELAAARVRLFGVNGLRERLGERFKLLRGGSPAAAPRHQALLATIDWSQQQLSEFERAELFQLSTCVGGFGLEFAQRMCADESHDAWAVVEALSSLVDGSLVQVEPGDPPRYRLLESTRAYALEGLAQAGQAGAAMRRHAHALRDYFIETEEQRFGENGSLTMADYMRRLSPELDNLRAALDWAMGLGDDLATALALCGASAMMLRWSGLSEEGLQRVLQVRRRLEQVNNPANQASLWLAVSHLGDIGRLLPLPELLDTAQRAVAIYRKSGHRRRLYQSLYNEGWLLSYSDQSAAVAGVLEEMRQLERAPDPAWLRALRQNLVGGVALREERFDEAAAIFFEQDRLLAAVPGEELSLIRTRNNLCGALNCLGRFEDAIAVAKSAIALGDEVGRGALGYTFFQLLHSYLFLAELDQATETMRRAMPGWRRDAMVLLAADQLGLLLAEQGRVPDAVRIDAAAGAYTRRTGPRPHPVRVRARQRTAQLVAAAHPEPADLGRWQSEGEQLDEAAIAAICLQK